MQSFQYVPVYMNNSRQEAYNPIILDFLEKLTMSYEPR